MAKHGFGLAKLTALSCGIPTSFAKFEFFKKNTANLCYDYESVDTSVSTDLQLTSLVQTQHNIEL